MTVHTKLWVTALGLLCLQPTILFAEAKPYVPSGVYVSVGGNAVIMN